MNGLESVATRPDVVRYLADNRLVLGNLMPGWPGWDSPHLCSMAHGGIVPIWEERLLDDAEAWARKTPAQRFENQKQIYALGRPSINNPPPVTV